MPYVFLLYIVAFLDRVNVGYAGLQMAGDLGFSAQVFGLGAGIFFFGYVHAREFQAQSSSSAGARASGSRAS
jgi:membrane associated rhomboid family serine protease